MRLQPTTLLSRHDTERFILGNGLCIFVIFMLLFMCQLQAKAGEANAEVEMRRYFPLGSIGGRAHLATGDKALRIVWLADGQAGKLSGLREKDLIIGINGTEFPAEVTSRQIMAKQRTGPLEVLGNELDVVSGASGKLNLMVRRDGKDIAVSVSVPRNGSFNPQSFPYNCPKAKLMYEMACAQIVKRAQAWPAIWGGSSSILTRGLAMLALCQHDNKAYQRTAEEMLNSIRSDIRRDFEKITPQNTNSGVHWINAWAGTYLCEYYLHNPSPELLQDIEKAAVICNGNIDFALSHPEEHYIATWPMITVWFLYFYAQAEKCGANVKVFDKYFKLVYEQVTIRGTDSSGNVTYLPITPGSHSGSDSESVGFRNGPAALAMFQLKEAPRLQDIVNINLAKVDELHKLWAERMAIHSPGTLPEAHTVTAAPLALAMAGIASYDKELFIKTMLQYRWYYTLCFEPVSADSNEWTCAYIRCNQEPDSGGDTYMNGEGFVYEKGGHISVLQNTCVAYVLAAADERLSFYGNKLGIKEVSRSRLSRRLQVVYDLLDHGDVSKANKLNQRVLDDKKVDEAEMVAAKHLLTYIEQQTQKISEKLESLLNNGEMINFETQLSTAVKNMSGLSDQFDERLKVWKGKLRESPWSDYLKRGKKLYTLKAQYDSRPRDNNYFKKLYQIAQEEPDSLYSKEAQDILQAEMRGLFAQLAGSATDVNKFTNEFKYVARLFSGIEELSPVFQSAYDDLKKKNITPAQIMTQWERGDFLALIASKPST